MMRTVEYLGVAGAVYFAYPSHSSSTYSLANWTTHRVQLVELAAPNTGNYQGEVDDAKGYVWYIFSGSSQPSDWGQAVAVVDFTLEGKLTAERLAKLDLIGTGAAIVQTPVSITGQLTTLVIGDDYLVSLGTQITFRVTTTSTPTACTLAFLSACGTLTLSVSGTVTEVESGVFDLVFEITRVQNAGLVAGVYNYSVEMRDAGGNKITVAHSDLSRSRRMNWVTRYT